MISRVMNSLARKRSELNEKEKGFTLIELLVVVIIIGILAAIAIPVYLGIQNNAKNAAIQADLTNAKTAVTAYYTKNPAATTAPALTTAILGSYGLSLSTGDSLAYGTVVPTTAGTDFCITGTRTNGGATDSYSVTANGGVVNSACP